MQRNLIRTVLTTLLLTITSQANAQQTVLFDFRTTGGAGVVGDPVPPNTNFDPGNAGDTIALEAGISVTIVDITAPEYDVTGALPVQTGITLSAAAGDMVNDETVIARIEAVDALGIDNPSIDNAQNDLIGDGRDSGDFNPGETITLTFDQDVVFTEIELESVQPTDSFEVLVGGVSMLQTTGDDQELDSLGGLTDLTIPAGTEVTFAADGLLTTENASSFRIETFTLLDSAGQEVLFDFRSTGGNGLAGTGEPNLTNLDPGSVGESALVDGLSLTLVDITAPEYDVSGDVPVETGVILSAAAGANIVTNISGDDALGIQNPSIGNADFDLIGDGNESSDLNPGETLTFIFDQDVQFTEIELEAVQADDTFDVLVDGVIVLQTTGDDEFLDDLGGLTDLTISAGTEVTFAVGGILNSTESQLPSTSIRIETFTVLTTAVSGDFNGDGMVDCDDLDGYIGNIDTAVPDVVGGIANLDFDSNGMITEEDAEMVIQTLVVATNGITGTFLGDFNCDGSVDVLEDAFALIGSLGGVATSYSQGDANFDGVVDVLGDAFVLVANLGNTNEPATTP